MVRAISALLGAGLIVLWLYGLGTPESAWITWLDLFAAVGAFIVAGAVPSNASAAEHFGYPMGQGIGLLAIWLVGLLIGAAPSLVWANFAFACAYVVLAFAGRGRKLVDEANVRSDLELPFDRGPRRVA